MGRSGVVLLIAAFLVGGAMGYGLPGIGEDGAVEPRPQPQPSGDTRPDPGVPPSSAVVRSPESATGPRGPKEPVSGDGAIHGDVRTSAGRPLGGVLVRAELLVEWPQRRRHKTGVPPDTDLRREVRGLVDRDRTRVASRRESVSGEDGRFVLEGLVPGRSYRLAAWRKGYLVHPRMGTSTGKAGDELGFIARPMIEVRVSISLPDGGAPESAEIGCRTGDREFRRSWRPDDPFLLLEPGDWTLTPFGGEFAGLEGKPVEITLAEGDPERPLGLELAPRAGISGRLLGLSDGRLGFSLLYLRVPGDGAVEDDALVRHGVRVPRSGPPDHRFGLFGVPDGTYRIGFVQNRRVVASALVELAGEPVNRDITIPPEPDSAFLTVTVEGPDGRPVGDASVWTFFRATDRTRGTASGNGRHVAGGTYRVRHPRLGAGQEGEGGRYFISVDSKSLGSREVPYPGPTVTERVVRLAEPGRIEVALEGYERSAYMHHVEVKLSRLEGGRSVPTWFAGSDRPDLTGRLVIGPLAPGGYEVEIRAEFEGAPSFAAAKAPVEVGAGNRVLRVPLPPLFHLTLTTGRDARYEVRAKSYRSRGKQSKGGRVTFGPLPAGEYTVSERGGGEPERKMTLRVDRDTEVAFEPD